LALPPSPVCPSLIERIDRLESLTPDPDQSDYFLVNCAANAVSAIQSAFQYYETDELDNVVKSSQLAIATIDEYIGRVDFPQSKEFSETSWFHAWARNHPLLMEEVERQRKDLEILASSMTLNDDVIRRIRKESARCGIQPFRRGLL
jgi:hypothetical protein